MNWSVQKLPNGSTGCTCPHCGGKIIVNPNMVGATRERLGLDMMICVYCERVSGLEEMRR